MSSATPTPAAGRRQKKRSELNGDEILALDYRLEDLPSSQHRAGLAGLVLLIRWLGRQPDASEAVCDIDEIGAHHCKVRFDATGFKRLFDAVYDATQTERAEKKPRVDKTTKREVTPLRIEDVPELDPKTKEPRKNKDGSLKTSPRYFYPQIVPRGAMLQELDASAEGLWIKLWRDVVWTILRGVPATRRPFNLRATSRTDNSWERTFTDLLNPSDSGVTLPSTLFLGAQEVNAETVAFRDRTRTRFLLEFWPMVAQLYVPRQIDRDGKSEMKSQAFVFAIPDITTLDVFCEEYPHAMRARGLDGHGYRPADALVDTLEEGALESMRWLSEQVAASSICESVSDLLLAVDVISTCRDGNNVRVLGVERLEPDAAVISEYGRVRRAYWDVGFRRKRIENLIRSKRWYTGFGRYLSSCPRKHCIESNTFKHDAREAFTRTEEVSVKTADGTPPRLDGLVYRIVGTYLSAKLKRKHDISWDQAKESGETKDDYSRKREKLARSAFLAVRSRTGGDFVEYFSASLFSVSQHLSEAEYLTVSKALLENHEEIRTLTLLALSARG